MQKLKTLPPWQPEQATLLPPSWLTDTSQLRDSCDSQLRSVTVG